MPSKNAEKKPIDRKEALKKMTSGGKKLLQYSLPFLGFSLTNTKANAQFGNLEVGRALNYLLQIEFMQELFYVRAVVKNGFLTGKIRTLIIHILQNQQAHVILLKNSVRSLGIEQAPQLDFDFTAGGQFQPFNNPDDFLALAQLIEDTAVGVYKQQVNIMHENDADPKLLRLIMRAQSTEGRHSTFIRILRKKEGLESLQHWLSAQDINTLPEGIANIYREENNTSQNNVDVPSVTTVSEEAVSEGWDEPVDRGLANNVFELFDAHF